MRTLKSAGLLLCLVGTQVTTRAEAANEPETDMYQWHAEFVATNPYSRTLTVKARMVSPEASAGLGDVRPGDAIVITWSGFRERAHGIRRVDRQHAGGDQADQFRLRGTFDAVDPATQYLTFTIDATADSLSAVTGIEPGDWATFISAHQPRNARAVLAAAVFGESPPAPRAPVAAQRRTTYQWHGELVTRDQPAGAITVRSRIASNEGLADLSELHTGEPILITWSGSEHHAHGIRFVESAGRASVLTGNFQMLATFVAANPVSRLLTFRVRHLMVDWPPLWTSNRERGRP